MIRILTDSACDILPAEAQQLGVTVIPLNVTLEDGTEADFITSRSGFQAQVHGEKGVHALGLLWPDAAPVLRAVFLEEAQAQSRTQAQPEPDISLPEQPASEATEPEQPQFTTETVAVYPGDKNNLPYDVEILSLIHI